MLARWGELRKKTGGFGKNLEKKQQQKLRANLSRLDTEIEEHRKQQVL